MPHPTCGGPLIVCATLATAISCGVAQAQEGQGRAPAAPIVRLKSAIPAKGAAKGGGAPKRTGGAGAVVPGFETLADGSTRFFVELSQPVTYDAKTGGGALTYVLKGAHVDKRNNYNPLVTIHFNTPVTSARLAPHGADLWFVLKLRGKVTPSVTMDTIKEGGAMLRVAFPKGDYVPVSPPSAESDSSPPTATEDDTPSTDVETRPPPKR